MNFKNKIKLRRISLLTSLGILLTTQNIGATSYSQTLTGDLETDSDQGYLITETLPGRLTYNFLPDDRIHILGDHSALPPEGSIQGEYYGIKIESGNSNNLDLTSLKNISIDLNGLSGVTASESYLASSLEAVGVRDEGEGEQSFGDDTQINIRNTSGNLIVGTDSNMNLTSSFTGIRQDGSNGKSSQSSQSFGDHTQIRVNDALGDLTVAAGSNIELYLSQIGIGQSSNFSTFMYDSATSYAEMSNTQEFGDNIVNNSSQIFGDDTKIYLSNRQGNITIGDRGIGYVNADFNGISQITSFYKNEHSGNDDYAVTSNQVFGDNTRIVIDNTIEKLTVTGSGESLITVTAIGINQMKNFSGSNYDDANNVTINNSQIFGNDTQIILTNTLGGFVSDRDGYNGNYLNMSGIKQYGSADSPSDSSILADSQTFGDNTRVILNSTRKEQPASEGGYFSSNENLKGISQFNSNSGSNQTFGKNTQIILKNTVGNLTIGNGGLRVSSNSTLVGIDQINSKNSTQTFGDNTQISLENTLVGVTTGDNENGINVKNRVRGIEQANYRNGNSQIFGNNTQINVKNYIGDLVSGGGESSINLESLVVGVTQNGSSGNARQVFGENTQIKVESKAGSIKGADSTKIYFSAMGIQHASYGGGSQMTFGNGTQINVHAEVGALEGIQESSSSVNAYGIYSAGGAADDLVFEGDLSVQATVKPLIRDGVVLVDQANAYSLFADDDGAIRLNDQGAHKITLVGDLGTGEWGSENQVTVDLSNGASYFQGTAKAQEGNIFLTLAEGATWRPQGDGDIDATFGASGGQLALKSGGVVDLAWWNNQNSTLNPSSQFRTLTIDHATLEDGGIFRVNSDLLHGQADRINIADASGGGTQYIQVAYDPSMTGTGGVLEALPGSEPIVLDIQGGTALDQVVGKMYQSDSPLHQYEIDPTIVSDGHQIRIGSLHYTRTENLSETPYTVVDAQAAFRNLWKLEGNNVLRRMGDLRLAPEENTSGAWARVYGGKLTSDSSYQRTFEQKYTGMQVGYDREHLLRNGKLYTGVMFNYLDSSPSYSSGSGSLYSKGLGAYGSWIGNNNHHVDLVLRASRLNNEYRLVDNNGNFASGSYDAWAYGISAEYGYRAQLKNQFFLEPQVELSFGHIGSADHKTDSGLSVQQNSINTAQSRIGLLLGKDFGSKNQKGNAYLRGSWVHDFSSNGTLDGFYQGDRARLKTADYQGGHLELNLGANVKVTQKLDTYLELTKTFGGKVDTDWQVNGGIRLMW